MKRAFLVVACAGALAASALPAGATPRFGAAEDAPKYVWDGGNSLYWAMNTLGMSVNRITVRWDPAQPDTIPERQYLDRMMPVAAARGIQVMMAVYPLGAWALSDNPDLRIGQFAAYLQELARTYPQVRDFIVGNEPNQPYFLQPQFGPNGEVVSAAVYERMLAAAYDALKAVNPGITVIAGGPSGSGNGQTSSAPVYFLQALGAAYRASGRTTPIMDRLAFHIYPQQNSDPPDRSYAWPHAGAADLDRLKQAVWDAFNGTGQPTFGEGASAGAPGTLTFTIDEFGWQAAVDPGHAGAYFGSENVDAVSEDQQAQDYSQLIGMLSCDPTVSDLLVFHLVDEGDLDRFQSGIFRADSSPRPAFDAVKNAIAAAGSCPLPHLWTHASGVVGAQPTFDVRNAPVQRAVYGLSATSAEPAEGTAGIFRIASQTVRPQVDAITRSLAGSVATKPVLSVQKEVKAGYTPRFELRGKLRAGLYVYAVRLVSEANPARSQTFVSAPFRVGQPPAKKAASSR